MHTRNWKCSAKILQFRFPDFHVKFLYATNIKMAWIKGFNGAEQKK